MKPDKIVKGIVTALAGAFLLIVIIVFFAACDGAFSEDEAPVEETVTEETPEPKEETPKEEPEPKAEKEQEPVKEESTSIEDTVFDSVFRDFPESQQAMYCSMWESDPDFILDQFMTGVEYYDPNSTFKRHHAESGFERNRS